MTSEQERELDDLNTAVAAVLATPAGKRVMFWLLELCRVYVDAYSGVDASTNYELGRQSVGRRIIDKLNEIDPRLYPKLMLEIADMKAMAAAAKAAASKENDDDLED